MDSEVFALSGFIVEPWSTLMNGSSRRFVIVLLIFQIPGVPRDVNLVEFKKKASLLALIFRSGSLYESKHLRH